MASFFSKYLRPYYKSLKEDLGSVQKLGQSRMAASTYGEESSKKLYKAFIENAVAGKAKILDDLLPPMAADAGSLFSCYYQEGEAVTSTDKRHNQKVISYPAMQYWYHCSQKEMLQDATKPIEDSFAINNYWKEVCESSADSPPLVSGKNKPIAFMVNVLKSPLLSPSRRNVAEIEFFLNYMPSSFPSQMVPYFNVEFQFPVYSNNASSLFTSRPSLLRFLLGSINYAALPLTEADKSLIAAFPTGQTTTYKEAPADAPATDNPANGDPGKNTSSGGSTGMGGAGKPPPATPGGGGAASKYVGETTNNYSLFSGMEMFTTPMTLTNMDKLGGGPATGRLNDVKPFLPAASLMGGSVKVINAGSGMFMHHSGEIELKIHDRARIVEFSEFIRGPSGYGDLTVWLTYGWLAPRGRGPQDAYAKFINENMLTRQAFSVKNAGFSFTPDGQASMKIELVSKAYVNLEVEPMADALGGSLTTAYSQIRKAMEAVDRERAVLGNPSAGAGGMDARIHQLVNACSQGNFQINMPVPDIQKLLTKAIAGVEQAKPTPANAEPLKRVLNNLLTIFVTLGPDSLKSQAKPIITRSIISLKDDTKKDPFFPTLRKNIKEPEQKYIFSEELVKTVHDASSVPLVASDMKDKKGKSQAPRIAEETAIKQGRDMVSFGKIFSLMCMPHILQLAAQSGIDEVQFNFYQLNESCGPASYHSIAEFPIHVQKFVEQLSDYIITRGGELMNVEEFLSFISSTQFADVRSPGYGMSSLFEPYSNVNKDPVKKSNSGDPKEKFVFEEKMAEWSANYQEFKPPLLAIKIETLMEGTEAASNVDLLNSIQGTVGVSYTPGGKAPSGNGRKIKKIHIYDKTANPYSNISESVFLSEDGSSFEVRGQHLSKVKRQNKKDANNKPKPGKPAPPVEVVQDAIFPDNKVKLVNGKASVSGRDVLRDLMEDVVPFINMGSNGSLIKEATLASKMDGLAATIQATGGSFRAPSGLSPSGLLSELNIPMRVIPAQLQMTTLGCPLADLYQSFFIDFGTGTTLDNIYSVTQIAHSFSPGKFDTNWTFTYLDGYSKFFGAQKFSKWLNDLDADMKEALKAEAAPAANATPAAKPEQSSNALNNNSP